MEHRWSAGGAAAGGGRAAAGAAEHSRRRSQDPGAGAALRAGRGRRGPYSGFWNNKKNISNY